MHRSEMWLVGLQRKNIHILKMKFLLWYLMAQFQVLFLWFKMPSYVFFIEIKKYIYIFQENYSSDI